MQLCRFFPHPYVMRTEREMHLILWPWSCLVWHDSGMRWFFFLFGSLECVYSNHSKPFCWRRKTINFSVQCIFWNLLTVWWTTFFRARTGVSYFNTHTGLGRTRFLSVIIPTIFPITTYFLPLENILILTVQMHGFCQQEWWVNLIWNAKEEEPNFGSKQEVPIKSKTKMLISLTVNVTGETLVLNKNFPNIKLEKFGK